MPSIRSMPTLQIWMAPFVSMTMQEKLGLLKTALCRAFAFQQRFFRVFAGSVTRKRGC
jgi:hypothetical protein